MFTSCVARRVVDVGHVVHAYVMLVVDLHIVRHGVDVHVVQVGTRKGQRGGQQGQST